MNPENWLKIKTLIEDIVSSNNQRENVTQDSSTNEMITPYSRTENCYLCGQRGHLVIHCKNEVLLFCHWCGRKGVIPRNCPCPKPHSVIKTRTSGTNSTVNLPKTANVTVSKSKPSTQPRPQTSRQNHLKNTPKKDARPFVNVQFGDKTFRALINSGTISSFINREVAYEITRLNLASMKLSELKDERGGKIIGKMSCPVTVGKIEYVLDFHVIPSLDEAVILG
ncbi:hypothetical protein PV325_011470, partial [Microctonus aethiopoides]